MTYTLSQFESDALDTLLEYGRIPCLSPAFDAEWQNDGHLDRAVALLEGWARERQFANSSVAVHRLPGRTPVLVVTVEATAPVDGTVVLYGHLDKQPPLGDWSAGLDPYSPVRRDNRVYARGLADDGYSTFAALLALEEIERQGLPHARCVVLIEASEESGSPDLEAYLDALTDHLGRVELMICLDSGALTYDRLWVTTSLRGVLNLTVRVDVLTQGQHSGSASGVVPSSFRVLRQILDRVEDSRTGDVLIRELHGDIPSHIVAAASALADEFGDVAGAEMPTIDGLELMGADAAERLLNRTWRPTLSIVGMGGIPDPAIAGNVLRPYTEAVLSLRLPPNVDADAARRAVEAIVLADPPSHASISVEASAADGWECPPLAPWLDRALRGASREAFGREPGFVGEGGSIPFLASLGRRYPGVQFVATGVLGPHSNAHGIDEMLDLDCLVGVLNCVVNVVAAHATKEN